MGTTQSESSEPKTETKIQYIDRHHFHYDFNVIHNGGSQNVTEDFKNIDPSANTTSTTQAINSNNPD